MALITRVSRLLRADVHAVLDRLEEPDVLLQQAIRDMEEVVAEQRNQVNLARWRKYLPKRPVDSLATLLADDMRYKNQASANDAYGEGWALTYFLIKTRRKEYVDYLKLLSEGRPLAERTKRERVEMFENAFDSTLADLDRAFVTYMRRVR